MSKRASEAALKRFPEEMTRIPYQDLIEAFGGKEYVDFNSMPRGYFQLGYESAEKDLITLIESRLAEILGDAQPKPALRAELQEIIKRIKEDEQWKP